MPDSLDRVTARVIKGLDLPWQKERPFAYQLLLPAGARMLNMFVETEQGWLRNNAYLYYTDVVDPAQRAAVGELCSRMNQSGTPVSYAIHPILGYVRARTSIMFRGVDSIDPVLVSDSILGAAGCAVFLLPHVAPLIRGLTTPEQAFASARTALDSHPPV